MKLGEIKLEALRIMNINNDSVLLLERIDSMINEKKYAKYLHNITKSINKAIDYINHRKVSSQHSINMSDLSITYGAKNNRFDVSTIPNFMSVARIVYEDSNNYLEKVPYDKIGNLIALSKIYQPENLTLIFDVKIPSVTDAIGDDDEVPGLSDELARLIPYYIKFDLYQEDEPDLAMNSKATFEQGVEALRTYDEPQDVFVIDKIYSSEDC